MGVLDRFRNRGADALRQKKAPKERGFLRKLWDSRKKTNRAVQNAMVSGESTIAGTTAKRPEAYRDRQKKKFDISVFAGTGGLPPIPGFFPSTTPSQLDPVAASDAQSVLSEPVTYTGKTDEKEFEPLDKPELAENLLTPSAPFAAPVDAEREPEMADFEQIDPDIFAVPQLSGTPQLGPNETTLEAPSIKADEIEAEAARIEEDMKELRELLDLSNKLDKVEGARLHMADGRLDISNNVDECLNLLKKEDFGPASEFTVDGRDVKVRMEKRGGLSEFDLQMHVDVFKRWLGNAVVGANPKKLFALHKSQLAMLGLGGKGKVLAEPSKGKTGYTVFLKGFGPEFRFDTTVADSRISSSGSSFENDKGNDFISETIKKNLAKAIEAFGDQGSLADLNNLNLDISKWLREAYRAKADVISTHKQGRIEVSVKGDRFEFRLDIPHGSAEQNERDFTVSRLDEVVRQNLADLDAEREREEREKARIKAEHKFADDFWKNKKGMAQAWDGEKVENEPVVREPKVVDNPVFVKRSISENVRAAIERSINAIKSNWGKRDEMLQDWDNVSWLDGFNEITPVTGGLTEEMELAPSRPPKPLRRRNAKPQPQSNDLFADGWKQSSDSDWDRLLAEKGW